MSLTVLFSALECLNACLHAPAAAEKGPEAASAAWAPDVLQQLVGAVPGSRTQSAGCDLLGAETTLLPAALCSSAWTRLQ